jgi:hypothetical protein
MAVSILNPQLIKTLESFFVRSDRASTAWGNTVSAFLSLSALRGLWTLGSVDESGNAYDLSGQGRTLSYFGNPLYDYYGLAPFIELDGAGDYLARGDEAGLDIIGTESYIANPGLSLGGWFYFDSIANREGLMTKAGATAALTAYSLEHRGDLAGSPVRFTAISGATGYNATSSAATSIDTWYFTVGRFVPGVSVDVYLNGAKDSLVAGVPASLNNVAAQFQIGARGATGLLDGRASLCFLCASALSDGVIRALYHTSRALFST